MEPQGRDLLHVGAEEFECSICRKRGRATFNPTSDDVELPEGWSYGPEGMPLCDDCTLYFMAMLMEFTF
ncbi:MAG: hypothetical protein DRG31_06790 [Deltaproteobacteria bacterium]|nr:MAG: hypothetical protein DRG31_06790 [Deltaproteobacteria bacterium]